MGSSVKKKNRKNADFQKPKLKVGKARPKPTNFTDTSFKSRSIAIPTQSIRSAAPSAASQLSIHLAHLNSHSSTTRYEHLGALHSILGSFSSGEDDKPPVAYSTLLASLNQLILDPDNRVRATLLKTFPMVPLPDISDGLEKTLPYIRAGIAHLSSDIRSTSLDLLSWMLDADSSPTKANSRASKVENNFSLGEKLVSCPGGWVKGLKTFMAVMGWTVPEPSSTGQESTRASKSDAHGSASIQGGPKVHGTQASLLVKTVNTLASFLTRGLHERKEGSSGAQSIIGFPIRHMASHLLPSRPNAFAYLNLFGMPRDEASEMYEDVEERKRVLRSLGYEAVIRREIESLKREGGEMGRAAGAVSKVLKDAQP